MARILQDQVRTADDQLVEALQAAEAKYSQREKALNLKIAAGNEKLTSALAEITIKDNLVKQHIKVAEEAVVGKHDVWGNQQSLRVVAFALAQVEPVKC